MKPPYRVVDAIDDTEERRAPDDERVYEIFDLFRYTNLGTGCYLRRALPSHE